jgi:hypothetical protein
MHFGLGVCLFGFGFDVQSLDLGEVEVNDIRGPPFPGACSPPFWLGWLETWP